MSTPTATVEYGRQPLTSDLPSRTENASAIPTRIIYNGRIFERAEPRPLGFVANIMRALSDLTGDRTNIGVLPNIVKLSVGFLSLGIVIAGSVEVRALIDELFPQARLITLLAVATLSLWEMSQAAPEIFKSIKGILYS